MNIKTVRTVDGVNTVDFGNTPDRYYWVKNIGDTTVYVSSKSDIRAGGEGVSKLDVGEVVMVEDYDSKVYVYGAGFVEIHETDVAFCPFRNAPAQNGGETVNDNLLINPNFKINQRGITGTFSETGKYFVDRWKLMSGTVTINDNGTITLNGTIRQKLDYVNGHDVSVSVSAGDIDYMINGATGDAWIVDITAENKTISWAKLEYGGKITRFIPPDPATELLKCQRYYEKLYYPKNSIIFAVQWKILTQCSYMLQYAPKRVIPSVTVTGGRFVACNDYSSIDISEHTVLTREKSNASIISTLSATTSKSNVGWIDGITAEINAEL